MHGGVFAWFDSMLKRSISYHALHMTQAMALPIPQHKRESRNPPFPVHANLLAEDGSRGIHQMTEMVPVAMSTMEMTKKTTMPTATTLSTVRGRMACPRSFWPMI